MPTSEAAGFVPASYGQRGKERVFQFTDPHEWGSSPSGWSSPPGAGLALIGFVGLCLLVGAAGGALAEEAVRGWYLSLTRPPGTPPNWIFGPVWGVLYVLMGVAAWLVWRRAPAGRALRLWGWQLALNAVWTPAFFGLHSPLLGLAVVVALLPMIVVTLRGFAVVDRRAAWLMVPYLLWSGYAFALNIGFVWLNSG